jgi:hypothetical protein
MCRKVLSVILRLFVPFFFPASHLLAQQVDCTVQVNYEAVATTYKDLLTNFASDVSAYVNNYQWGTTTYDQKTKCTLNIFIQGATGENRYQAQVFVGSQRPIFGTQKSSAVLRLFDESWEFTYLKNQPINHNLYSFSDLASVLDFYMYIILGYDYDTYEELSGTPLFQKAADVASLGNSSGQKGWQHTTGTYNRVQLIDEVLNPKFEPVRRASYVYHFTGLDSLLTNPGRAYTNILTALETIGKAKKEVDPRNIVLRSFFEAKHLELADLFVLYSDPSVYALLSAIDPSHQTTYEQYRSKHK